MQKNNLFWKNKTKMLTAFQNLYRLAPAMKSWSFPASFKSGLGIRSSDFRANRSFLPKNERMSVFPALLQVHDILSGVLF